MDVGVGVTFPFLVDAPIGDVATVFEVQLEFVVRKLVGLAVQHHRRLTLRVGPVRRLGLRKDVRMTRGG